MTEQLDGQVSMLDLDSAFGKMFREPCPQTTEKTSEWVLGRISEKLGKDNPTMASLFDGSGSFPLIWEAINGKETAVWSSEVNPEAIRVSRYRIGGDASC